MAKPQLILNLVFEACHGRCSSPFKTLIAGSSMEEHVQVKLLFFNFKYMPMVADLGSVATGCALNRINIVWHTGWLRITDMVTKASCLLQVCAWLDLVTVDFRNPSLPQWRTLMRIMPQSTTLLPIYDLGHRISNSRRRSQKF